MDLQSGKKGGVRKKVRRATAEEIKKRWEYLHSEEHAKEVQAAKDQKALEEEKARAVAASEKEKAARHASGCYTAPPDDKFDAAAAEAFLTNRWYMAVGDAVEKGVSSSALFSSAVVSFDPVSVNSEDNKSVEPIPAVKALFANAAQIRAMGVMGRTGVGLVEMTTPSVGERVVTDAAGQGSASAAPVESPSSVVSSGSQDGSSGRSNASGSDVSVAEAEALSSTSTNPARDLISILQQNTRQADDAKRAQAEQLARQIAADRLAAEEAARKAEDALRQMQETLRQSAATRDVEAAALEKQKEDSTEQQRKLEELARNIESKRRALMAQQTTNTRIAERKRAKEEQIALPTIAEIGTSTTSKAIENKPTQVQPQSLPVQILQRPKTPVEGVSNVQIQEQLQALQRQLAAQQAEKDRLVAEAVKKAEMEAYARQAAMQEQLAFLRRQLAAQQAEKDRLVAEAVKQAEIKKSDAERQEQAKQRIKQLIAIRRLIQEEKRKKRDLEEQGRKLLEERKAAEEAASKAFLEAEAQKEAARVLIEKQKRDAEFDIRISQVNSSLETLYGKKVGLTTQLQAVQEQVAQLNTHLEALNTTMKAANKNAKSTLAKKKTELLTSIEKSNKRLGTINGIIQGINAEILAHQQQIEELQSAKSNTTPKPSSIAVAEGLVVQKEMAALRHGLDKRKARAKIAPASVAKVVEVIAAHAPVSAPANPAATAKKKKDPSSVQSTVATAAPSVTPGSISIVIDPPATAEKSLSELQEDLRLLEERIGNCKKYLSSQRQEDITRREEFTQALSELEEAKVALLKRMQELQPTPDAVSTPSNVVVSGPDSPASAPVDAAQKQGKKKKKKNNGSPAAVIEQTSQYLTKKAVTSLLDDLCSAVTKKRNSAIDGLNEMIVLGEIDACKLISEIFDKIKAVSAPNQELKEWKYFQAIINNFSLEESFLDQLFVNAAIFPGLYKKVLEQFQVTESVTEAIEENNLPKIKALVQYYPEWVARHAVYGEDVEVARGLVEYAIEHGREIEMIKSLLIPGSTNVDCYIKAFEYINDDNYMVESMRSFSVGRKKEMVMKCIAQLQSNVLEKLLMDNTEADDILRQSINNCEWALLTNLFEYAANRPLADVAAAKQMIDKIFAYGFTGVRNHGGASYHVLIDILQIKGVNRELLAHVIQKSSPESLNAQYSINGALVQLSILTVCIQHQSRDCIELLKRSGSEFSLQELAAAISTRKWEIFERAVQGVGCAAFFDAVDQTMLEGYRHSNILHNPKNLLDCVINHILVYRDLDFDIRILDYIFSNTTNRTTYHNKTSFDEALRIAETQPLNKERKEIFTKLRQEVNISETGQYPQVVVPQPLQGRAAAVKMTELVASSMGGGRGRG